MAPLQQQPDTSTDDHDRPTGGVSPAVVKTSNKDPQMWMIQHLPLFLREPVFLGAVFVLAPLVCLASFLPTRLQNVLCAVAPSISFWVTAGGLHLMGANKNYQPKGLAPSVSKMIRTQLFVDVVQCITTLPRFYLEPPENFMKLRVGHLVLGILVIDWIEYWTHRALHVVPCIKWLHKKHHQLIPVHTFGSYYNHVCDMILVGACLGLSLVHGLKLSVLEVAICSSLGTICTVFDHCPGKFFGATGPTHHEIHHNVNSNTNFSQPFTPFLDYLFGTLYKSETKKLS